MAGMTAGRGALAAAMLAALGLTACASSGANGPTAAYRTGALRPYEIGGQRYEPRVYSHYEEKGLASWYSYPAGTRRTASGEWFDARGLTAAHKTLPLPCEVEVTNLENGRKVRVRINDRGPFADGRVIDLSRAAADRLGFTRAGTTRVRVKLLGPAPVASSDQVELAETAPAEGEGAQLR